MTGISIELDYKEMIAVVRQIQARMADVGPLMRSIGGAMLTNVDLEFRGGHDPWDAPWKELSQRTLELRRKGRGGGNAAQILVDTGRLRDSFSPAIIGDGGNSVTIGTSVEYAADHQFGVPNRRLPKRQILPQAGDDLPPSWKDEIISIANAYLMPK